MKNPKKLLLTVAFAVTFAFVSASAQTRPLVVVTKPTPKPFPAVTVPTPAPLTDANPALDELRSKIRLSSTKYETRRGSIGIKIVSLSTGKVVYEDGAERYFMPASNMKNFTVATAIERLSPGFKFVTSVFANSKPDETGTVKGDLTIYGRGDVSFSTSFDEGDYFKRLDDLADAIMRAGVTKIEGNLVGDESYFSGYAIPAGWEWDDLQWYYGAEVSALPYNDNTIVLSVSGGTVGYPCIVNMTPFNSVVRIANTCMTTAAGTKQELSIHKSLDQNVFEISGTMPVGGKYSNSVTVTRPAELFISLLKDRLEKKGVVITGTRRVISGKDKSMLAVASSVPPVEIAKVESLPLSVIAAKTLKPSQNMYTETLLWTLGEEGRAFFVPDSVKNNPYLDSRSTSSDRGLFVVKNFLTEIGIAPDGIVQYDGSGLSRHNLVTPAAVADLYVYMATKSRYASTWYNALTIGGVDGTLRNRFKGTKAMGNVRGKTGTIDQVSALSGYVTTAGGERLAFSIIVNGVASGPLRVSTIDEIVGQLANYNGKLE